VTAWSPPGSSWPAPAARTPWCCVRRHGWWAWCPTPLTGTSPTATSSSPRSARRPWVSSPSAWPTASPRCPARMGTPTRPASGWARSVPHTWTSLTRNPGCSPPRSPCRSSTPTALRTTEQAGTARPWASFAPHSTSWSWPACSSRSAATASSTPSGPRCTAWPCSPARDPCATSPRPLGSASPSSPSPSSARAWPDHRDPNSVAKLRDQPVVVGYLVLVGRADAEQRAADRVSDTMAPRPGGEDVVEAPVGVQADRGQGIAVGPGVAGRAVSRHLPAVIEHQPGTRGGGTAGEHPDLVGIGPGVEIAADDDEIALRSDLADQGRQLSHLGLADAAAIERVTEHHREQLDWPAVAVHGDANDLPITRAVFRAQLAAPWLARGPP